VLCRDGLVIIAGALPSDYVLAPLAVHIARTTRGVRRVETYFTPRPAADTGDSALTEKIRGALAREGTAGVVGTDVAVVAGTAVLVGTADDEAHADHLVASAGAVDGIKSVKSFIQLRP
jgi:osmotically-inducible protein OsmY